MRESRVAVFHTLPLCIKCKEEVAKVKSASAKRDSGVQVKLSLLKRLKYGLQLLNMPVVVVDGRPFSVLGAFREEALVAELDKNTTRNVSGG